MLQKTYSGTEFLISGIERLVTLLDKKDINSLILSDLKELTMLPTGQIIKSLIRETMHGKRKPDYSQSGCWECLILLLQLIVVIPVKPGEDKDLWDQKLTITILASISADRLKVKGNNIFFKADGKSRGKIGIPPVRATGIMGSYDSENKILTLLICRLPEGKTDYVNSSWQIQDNPYSGDALNSYNDGPLEDGSQMGPFYELETSSPAADLKPGESLSHIQYTLHLTGAS